MRSLDFAGDVAPSTAAGLIDGTGYLAAAGAGIMVAQMKDSLNLQQIDMYCHRIKAI